MPSALDALMSDLMNKPLEEVEHRLHAADLQTRLRRHGDTDYGPPAGSCPNRVNLTVTRQGKVIAYEIG